jgi:hypothetical protein
MIRFLERGQGKNPSIPNKIIGLYLCLEPGRRQFRTCFYVVRSHSGVHQLVAERRQVKTQAEKEEGIKKLSVINKS